MQKDKKTEAEEDADDVRTYDTIKARIARGEEEIFPAEAVNRIIDGEESLAPPSTSAIHPGEILREEFLVPLGVSAADLADRLGVAHVAIEDIVSEKAPITEDIARRLGKHFETSTEVWIGMQIGYDRKIAAHGNHT